MNSYYDIVYMPNGKYQILDNSNGKSVGGEFGNLREAENFAIDNNLSYQVV